VREEKQRKGALLFARRVALVCSIGSRHEVELAQRALSSAFRAFRKVAGIALFSQTPRITHTARARFSLRTLSRLQAEFSSVLVSGEASESLCLNFGRRDIRPTPF
jgi:hypothetical protein